MINTVSISGKLGKDIELKKTQSGKSYIKFSLATFGGRKDGDSYRTEWITCEAWESTADRISKYGKGDLLMVQGVILTDSWKDQGGYTKYSTYVRVKAFDAPKKEAVQVMYEQPQNEPVQPASQYDEINSDDLPF